MVEDLEALKSKNEASKVVVVKYKEMMEDNCKLYEYASTTFNTYREQTWSKNEAERSAWVLISLWNNNQKFGLPCVLTSAHYVYSWDHACLLQALTHGYEHIVIPMSMSIALLDLL